MRGLDTSNSIKQAAEFGLVAGGQKLASLLLTPAEMHGLALQLLLLRASESMGNHNSNVVGAGRVG